MIEKPYFLNTGSYQLFVVKHEPSTKATVGFILCHPFGREKLWAQRVLVNYARELCSKGFLAIRFDFMGHGDSEGDFEDSTVQTRLNDLSRIVSETKKILPEDGKIVLLGLRFGATIAALYTENDPDIMGLVLWDPIMNGNIYINEALRANLTTQLNVYKKIKQNREALIEQLNNGKTVNIEGYEISNEFFSEVMNINLLDRKLRFKGKTFILQISRNTQKFNHELEKLKEMYANARLDLGVEDQFWRESKIYYAHSKSLFNKTNDWIESEL